MFLKRLDNISIKWKLAVPFLILSFIGTTVLVYIGLANRARLIEQQERRWITFHYSEFKKEMQDQEQLVLSLASTVAAIPEVQKAFAERDRDKLIKMLFPAFLDLKYNFGIRFFHFHTPPAKSFLRLHSLGQYGEDMSKYRPQILHVVRTGEKVAGLEKGALGYGIRGVVPIYYENRLAGTLGVGYSFGGAFLDGLKRRTGCDYTIFVKEKKGFSVLYTTAVAPAALTEQLLEKAYSRSEPEILISPPQLPNSTVLFGDILDYSKAKAALLEITADRSKVIEMLDRARKVTLIVAILGVIASFACVLFVTYRFLRPIRRIIFQTRAIAEGQRGEFLEPMPMDEVGVLNESINTMLKSLKESRKQIESYAAVLEVRVQERTADLIESEEKYRTLVENVPLVVYRMRPDGEIVFVNQFVEELFGYTATEIFRNPKMWDEKVYEQDRAKVLELRARSFREGKEFISEYRVKHKNGHIVYVMDHAIPFLVEHGKVASVDGIIMDVTGRVKLQEKLVRSEELKTISEVSARLAHEIRNPLVSAGGFARRLLSSMSVDDPNRSKVEIIVKEVSRLETILRMILNYIQPLNLKMTPTDANDLVGTALKAVDVDDQIQKKNIRVDLKLAKEPAMVSADYPQMVRLLETFIKNAVHQMEQGSVLAISTSVSNDIFFLFLQYPVRHMAPDDVEHFFYPFAASQVSYDTVDLPMTKIIVHKHGGTVDVFLDKSGELVIRVSLPLIEESKHLFSK